MLVKKPFISGLVEGAIDKKVYQDVLKTYAKEVIHFVNYGNIAITTAEDANIARVQFTECEISPFRHHEFPCHASQPSSFDRKASITRFSSKPIMLRDIEQFLIHTFSPNQAGHRPYPSPGGLYPVEPLVFLFKERITHADIIESGCYHFRPISKSLQRLKKISTAHFFKKLLHDFIPENAIPGFAVMYVAHIGKAIFKYRYRGYRHALMEAGAMYQQATIISQQMDLRTTVWSTFSEHEMLCALDLEYGTYMPLTMQLFGYGENT